MELVVMINVLSMVGIVRNLHLPRIVHLSFSLPESRANKTEHDRRAMVLDRAFLPWSR